MGGHEKKQGGNSWAQMFFLFAERKKRLDRFGGELVTGDRETAGAKERGTTNDGAGQNKVILLTIETFFLLGGRSTHARAQYVSKHLYIQIKHDYGKFPTAKKRQTHQKKKRKEPPDV